jgi:hypothetical protein
LRQLSPLEKYRGEQLAQFLNGEWDKCERIGELLGWCQQVYSLYRNRPPLSRSAERTAYERQQATLLTKINHLVLDKFAVVPHLVASEQGLQNLWSSVEPLSPEIAQAIRAFKSNPQPIGPHSAVMIILEMTGAGTVDRIRRCDNPDCLKWIMVTNSKRVTCSDVCRFEKYKKQKGSRANDMRQSRKLHKSHPHLKKQSSKRPAKTAKKGGK